jgi:hypothetical protein
MQKSDQILIGIAVAVVAAVAFFILSTTDHAYSRPAEGAVITLQDDPVQAADSTTTLKPITEGSLEHRLTVKAAYRLSGMLVSKHRYRLGKMTRLAPWDYAVAWGKTIDWLPYLSFSQASRYCFFKYKLSSPVDRKYVESHMSNNHLIPATPNLRRAFKLAKKRQPVMVEGYLVNVRTYRKDSETGIWNTSLIRDDIGQGACEIIYVTRLQLGDQIYE